MSEFDEMDLEHMNELEDDNAKLREDMKDLEGYDQMLRDRLRQVTELNVKADSENSKLRVLVRDMWFWGYEGHMDSESQEWQMKHIDGVLDRMRELGIEVDE